MSRVAAVFDVDQTLVQGHTERLFFHFLLRRELISVSQALSYLAQLATHPRDWFQDKSYLAGLRVEEVTRLGRRCYHEEIVPRITLAALDCVVDHQSKGHAVILVSGSLALLLQPLKEDLGADWLIATELQRDHDHFTGEIDGLHPRGLNKLQMLREWSRTQGIDLSQSYAYGDHFQDSHLFGAIGYPVAVNPSWRLKLKARKHRWPIRYFKV
jgi:putative phosphoserine phosphatase/1-acylglycerol-3-phosphate O-acyltransferase